MSPQDSRPKCVLIVDDDDGFRAITAEILQVLGYDVHCAENGQVALDQLRHGLRPGIILLDLMMPKMNGWEFLELQRQEPALAHIPVVILSGVDSLKAKTAPLGVSASLRKPVDLEILLDVIERKSMDDSSIPNPHP
jgi:two-component system, chemotaxis family, chemotaxis protein CheY